VKELPVSKDSPDNSTIYIPGLDGIRAIAFLLVYVAHAGLENLVPGGLGVTIFFFLSGYLITTLLRVESRKTGDISISQFYLRRVLRIFPPMYVTLAVWFVLMKAGVFVGSVEWRPVALASLYLTNYTAFFTPHTIQGGLSVLWSLAVEEHFYLLFPWVFLLFVRNNWSLNKRASFLGGLCLLALIWRYVLVVSFHSTSTYFHTDTRFDSILFGCLLAILMNPVLDPMPEWINRHGSKLALGGLVILLGCLLYRGPIFRETARYTLQGFALAGIFTFVLNSPRGWVVRSLETPFLRMLGRRSYAMYLIHYCIIHAISQRLGLNMVWTVIVSAPLVFGYAWAMWRVVEHPIATLKKRIARERRLESSSAGSGRTHARYEQAASDTNHALAERV
jgi:peptidoglycan/LPS O-acetylase OafA/YrhL